MLYKWVMFFITDSMFGPGCILTLLSVVSIDTKKQSWHVTPFSLFVMLSLPEIHGCELPLFTEL